MKIFSTLWIALRVVAVALSVWLLGNTANAQDTLKVMSYNIYHGEYPSESGASNLKEIAGLIRSEQPDLVALQEVDSLTGRSASLNNGTPQNLVKELADMTGMHGYFGKAIDFDGGGYGEGILSRTPVKIRKVMLPIPKGGEKRALLIAKTEVSGDEFLFAGTHLCHQFAENRIAQAQKINEALGDTERPVLLAGDLNFVPVSEPYHILSDHWIDLAKFAGSAEATYSYSDPSRRIDYLFLRKGSRKQIDILEVRVLKVGYSDHMPLVATIVLH